MSLSVKLIPQFIHQAPENYEYEVEEFKRGIFSIWLCYRGNFDYNNGKSSRTIWGFYDYKKCKFYSPVNSKTIGKEVQIENTRCWTSMPIKQTALEAAFV